MSETVYTTTRTPAAGEPEEETIGGLVSGLAGDMTTLVEKEIQLLRAEMAQNAKKIGSGIALAGAGAALGISGLTVLLIFVAELLDTLLFDWAGALIVAVVALLVAFLLAKAGMSKFSADNIEPDRTVRTVSDTADIIKDHV